MAGIGTAVGRGVAVGRELVRTGVTVGAALALAVGDGARVRIATVRTPAVAVGVGDGSKVRGAEAPELSVNATAKITLPQKRRTANAARTAKVICCQAFSFTQAL